MLHFEYAFSEQNLVAIFFRNVRSITLDTVNIPRNSTEKFPLEVFNVLPLFVNVLPLFVTCKRSSDFVSSLCKLVFNFFGFILDLRIIHLNMVSLAVLANINLENLTHQLFTKEG